MNPYLKQRIFMGIAFLVIALFIATRMWSNRMVVGNKKTFHKNIITKLLYTRIFPLIIVLVMSRYAILPIMDVVDTNKYETVGILKSISTSNNSISREYAIRIDNKIYRVPKALISYGALRKGDRYKINYHKYSRLIYQIESTHRGGRLSNN